MNKYVYHRTLQCIFMLLSQSNIFTIYLHYCRIFQHYNLYQYLFQNEQKVDTLDKMVNLFICLVYSKGLFSLDEPCIYHFNLPSILTFWNHFKVLSICFMLIYWYKIFNLSIFKNVVSVCSTSEKLILHEMTISIGLLVIVKILSFFCPFIQLEIEVVPFGNIPFPPPLHEGIPLELYEKYIAPPRIISDETARSEDMVCFLLDMEYIFEIIM